MPIQVVRRRLEGNIGIENLIKRIERLNNCLIEIKLEIARESHKENWKYILALTLPFFSPNLIKRIERGPKEKGFL